MNEAVQSDDIRNSTLYEMLEFERTGLSDEEKLWRTQELQSLAA
jgi:hypothetical protein